MKIMLLLTLSLFFSIFSYSQTINKIEYFFDTEPGYSNGIDVPLTPDSTLSNFAFNTDITSLSYGLHTLYIRSRDVNGKWSLTNNQTIYKFTPYTSTTNSGPLPSVNKIEYFIDTDPGYGNGVNVPVTADSLISNYSFNADITSLTYGLHTLYIRSRDENGKWSLTNNQTIYKFTPYINTSSSGSLPSVNKIEYFIDTDPGYGNAVNIPVTSDSIISNYSFNADITSLTYGLHTLYIRSRDVNGKWSLTNNQTIYKFTPYTSTTNSGPLPSVNKIEYFIDTDPGYGNGVNVPVTADSLISNYSFNADITSLTYGLHTLYIRSRDENGKWSLTNNQTIYKFTPYINTSTLSPLPAINKIEYFIDTDPGYGNGVNIPLISFDSIMTNFAFNVNTTGLPQGNHTLYIRTRDANGKWSLTNIKTFSSCPVPAAIADFTYVKDNQNFMFSNNSQNMVSCVWDFGDGATSTVFNPFHTYNSIGAHNVRLIAANINTCTPYKDTLVQVVYTDGISSINPTTVCNAGGTTIDVYGGGFVSGTMFKLKKAGQPSLNVTSPMILTPGHMRHTFNMNGVAIGLWDVEVTTPTATFLLPQSFAVTSANLSDSAINVSITGDWVVRIGFQQIYTVTIENTRDSDIVGVPVIITGLPANSRITYLNQEIPMDSISGLPNLNILWDSIPNVFLDSASNVSFSEMILPIIAANSIATIQFIIHVPDTTTLHSTPKLKVYADAPLFASSEGSPGGPYLPTGINQTALKECLDGTEGILKRAFKEALKGIVPVNDITSCLISLGITDSIFYRLGLAERHEPSTLSLPRFISFSKSMYRAADIVMNCGPIAISLTPAGKLATLLKTVKEAMSESKKLMEGHKAANEILENLNAVASCGTVLYGLGSDIYQLLVGNATDPNEKYGPGGGSNSHYTNETGAYGYTIGFENAPSANLPAQTVKVIDTLDKSKFEVSTFGFTSITIGDSSISFSNKPKSFIRDIDLTLRMGVKVRITGSIDTSTGIVNWVFNSINPATNQITTNALAGFLPPDTNSPLGQGYVSFLVNTKAGNQDTVHNRATIIFDYNAPIITNDWQSIIDTTKPNSTVDNLPSISTIDSFIVSWHGTDSLSGIRDYSVYVAKNGASYEPWLMNTSDTSSYFKGVKGNTYYFYTRATDSAGNIENIPGQYDASVFIVDCDSALQASLDTVGNVQICAGDSVILKATGGNSYLWSNGKTSDSIAIYASGYYSVLVSNNIGCTTHLDTTLVAVIPCNMGLNVKLFIEGYYIGSGMMSSALYNEGVSSNTSITDSIDIELRNQYAPYQVQYSTKILLDHMGYASSNIQVDSNYYYLAIKHRNGIQTWSAEPVFIPSSSIYDFTVNSSKAYGNNMKEIANHVWGLFSGDFNLDENIDLLDLAILESYIPYFQYGYFETDINGDGNVDLLDVPMVEQNINDFIFSNHP